MLSRIVFSWKTFLLTETSLIAIVLIDRFIVYPWMVAAEPFASCYYCSNTPGMACPGMNLPCGIYVIGWIYALGILCFALYAITFSIVHAYRWWRES